MKFYQKLIIVSVPALMFAMGYVAGRLFDSCPTPAGIAAIADSVAHAKIDSLCPSLVRKMQDWDVLHRQVQFHATLHYRFYNGKSKWHKHVRRELDETRQYWQPKNKEE